MALTDLVRRVIFGFLVLIAVTGWPDRAAAQAGGPFACKKGSVSKENLEQNIPLEPPDPARPGATRSRLWGSVVIECDGTRVFADEIEWFSDTDIVHIRGRVLFQQLDLSIFAERAELNKKTHLGAFYNLSGSARLTSGPQQKSLFGTQEPEVRFDGERLEKIGPKKYRLTNGSFTTCVQATPRWEITGSGGTVTLDERVVLYNSVMKVKGVPVFYLPLMVYPLSQDDRSTGFLIPTYSTSTYRGTGLSNAFFWAINRSQDLTLYHDYFSKAGQGYGSEYAFASAPGSNGNAKIYVLNERIRSDVEVPTIPSTTRRSYKIDANISQGIPHGFRVVGRVDYFNQISTQQFYQQNVLDLSQRTRTVTGNLSGGLGRVRISADFLQRDTYYSTADPTRPSVQRAGSAPVVNLHIAEKPIGRSRVYVGAAGQVGYFLRQDDVENPDEVARLRSDHSLMRFDGAPSIRAELSTLPFLRATTSASWRITHWLESLDPELGQVPVRLTRQMLEMSGGVTGPIIARVWQPTNSGYADRVKHLIEPSLTIRWTSPFDELDKVVRVDGTDSIVGGNMSVTYRLTNRVLRRKPVQGPAGAVGSTRQILAVSLFQTRHTNLLASALDPQYQSASASVYTPLVLHVEVQPADTVTAQFQVDFDSKYRAARSYAASGTIRGALVQANATWRKQQVIPGLSGFADVNATHSLSPQVTLNDRQRRIAGTYSFNWDVQRKTLLQQRVVAAYNSQCCGIMFDYQTVNFGSGPVPQDRRFGLSFTLAGIGSFSNPLGSFGR